MVAAMKRLIFPIALLSLSLAAWAQSYPQEPEGPYQGQEDPADAAEHGVARLSLIEGSVNVTRGSGESIGSTVNAPLEAADRVATAEGSRAEIQFDAANMIRLGANTSVRIGELQYHRYLVEIDQGITLFRVLRDSDAQIEISTPSAALAPLRQGIYRVTVRPDGSSEITVRAGEADLISSTGTERLPAGQTMLSRGSAYDAQFRSIAAIPYDDWDRWNADRDRFFERAPDALRYAGPDIDGTQELANYGRWVWDPAYGYVWVPNNEPPDWAPYRDGRWDYLDYYGWSWTSYDPWGWAPYHYGNWYRGSFGWAWYPGAIGPRHYWRPAMVGFFGFGEPGFGVSLGFGYGNVGWVPLAPFERYHPWYGRGNERGRGNEFGRAYAGGRSSGFVNNANIASVYRNARVNGAVTGLRAGDFGRVGVGRNSFVRPGAGELARAGMVSGGIPLAPARNFGSGNGRFKSSGSNVNNSRFNNSRSPGVANPGGGASNGNSGGWRRLDSQPGAPTAGGNNRSDVRSFSPQRTISQPVRISPPIVNNRYDSAPEARGNRYPGGFGGPRPNSGYGAGSSPVQRQQAAPAAPPRDNGGGGFRGGPPSGGGGFRGGPPSGGGAHGNGGGGGPHGGGGGPHGGGRH